MDNAGTSLTPEQAAKILKADEANIVKKVASGGTLSKEQRALLQNITVKTKSAGAAPSARFVKNQVELAAALGVERKTIQRWRKVQGNPGACANGRWDVEAWRQYLIEQGTLEPEDLSQTQLKAEQLQLQIEKLDFQLSVMKDEYVPRAVAKRVWTQFVNAAKIRSFSAVGRLVTLIRLAPDTTEAASLARQEIVELWHELETCAWFDATLAQPDAAPSEAPAPALVAPVRP